MIHYLDSILDINYISSVNVHQIGTKCAEHVVQAYSILPPRSTGSEKKKQKDGRSAG